MSNRTFERAVLDWLEDGSDRTPRPAIDAVLLAVKTTPQERDLRIPWRFPSMFNNRLMAAALAVVLIVGGGVVFTRFSSIGGPSAPPSPSPSAGATSPPATPAPTGTESAATWGGRILVEHFGNSPDGSENAPDGTPMLHRIYLVDPNNQTPTGYTEFLPGQPEAGKSSADVSRDGTKVVFQDWADPSSIYIASIDGTGFSKLTPAGCGCSEWDPAFNSTATKVAYGHAEGNRAWLEVLDLATGERTTVPNTTGSALDNVVESPSWSPDGSKIIFVRTKWDGRESTMGLVHYNGEPPTAAMLTIAPLAEGTITHFETGDSAIGSLIPGDPFFSPDGSTILFTDRPYTKMPHDPASSVYIMKLDGTGLTRVVDAADSGSWTPDGTWILSTYNFFRLTPVDGGSSGGLVDIGATDNTDGPTGFIYVGFWVGNP